MKRKAPLPPCVRESATIPYRMDPCPNHQDQLQDIADSDVTNCKPTRKFGVISRSSFNQDHRDNSESEIQSCYLNAPLAEVNISLKDSDCSQKSSPQIRTIHSYNGAATTLPGRSHSQMLECRMHSFTSEATTQVRHYWHTDILRFSQTRDDTSIHTFSVHSIQIRQRVPGSICH